MKETSQELDCCHPANSWQISGSGLAPACPSSALLFKYFIHSWSLLSSWAVISPMSLMGLQMLIYFSAFLFPHGLGFSHLRKLEDFHHHSSLLTCCVEVKVGRFIGNVPCCLQSRSLCCHFACISLGFVNIHFKWALRDVLPSKQDWNLETDSISLDPPGRGRVQITMTVKHMHS